MRKIEKQMNFAISNKGNWRKDNTEVEFNESTNCSTVKLHGNSIATFDHNLKAVKLSSCGWETVTTKSRLNAILDCFFRSLRVYAKDFIWYIGEDKFFDGYTIAR